MHPLLLLMVSLLACPPVKDSGSPDEDGDGYGRSKDCDDDDPWSSPGAVEVCDGIDNDCDGVVDDGPADGQTWYADTDADGYGDGSTPLVSCSAPRNTVSDATDCDDTAATVHPDGIEVCDGLDNDCDGQTDEEGAANSPIWYLDDDGDGYGAESSARPACDTIPGYIRNGGGWTCRDPSHHLRRRLRRLLRPQ